MIVAPTVDIYRALRKLIHTNDPSLTSSKGSFTIVSYNIIAQSHIKREMYPYCAKDTLRWAYRRRRLQVELESMDADILALQEVDHWGTFFQDQLAQRGYDGFFCEKERRRTSISDQQQPKDGLVVAWRRDQFRMIRAFEIDLAPTMPDLADATPNIGQVVVLEKQRETMIDSITEKSYLDPLVLVIINTHLYWKPGFDALRAIQAAMLIREASQREPALTSSPVILCGDFNSDPTSRAYHLLTRGDLDMTDPEIQQRLKLLPNGSVLDSRCFFTSAYQRVTGREPPWTTWSCGFKDTLDYIFYTNNNSGNTTIHPSRVLHLPNDQIVEHETALPNHAYASDHVALMAEFQITN